ncbi:MAG: symmetrical bis(5'-nucleosyl)-tetraphosphatase [Acidobacteriota bacterium]|nr:symmetrical bis(5'-nucleosyl)-tetraphosphatase [Acidobacteriota bacterium]
MSTWVVGDVQGCFSTFQALLDRLEFRPGRDRLWFVGDLVNRGPDSLGMLRWAYRHRDSLVCVLGNHDLHLLAQREGVIPARPRDTLAPVLRAPDVEELCDWVAGLPFVHLEGGVLLVHAGVVPGWGLPKVESGGKAASHALAQDRAGFLRALYALRGDGPAGAGQRSANGFSEAVTAASVFTRIRIVDGAGRPAFDFDGTPEDVPPGHRPWFEGISLPDGLRVLFGHWAALGLMVSEGAVCLDSGCVWNGFLTALRLEDGVLRIQPAAAGDGGPL